MMLKILLIVTLAVLSLVWGVVFILGASLAWGVWTTLLAACVWVGFTLFAWQARRLRARRLGESLKNNNLASLAEASPADRLQIQELQEQFDHAVRALKGSALGGGGGAALYALPWYMIIGPSGSGKSTALRESGLHFPYANGRGAAVRGMGGTRNCDWWLGNEAVFLDTAGRYAHPEENQGEWFAFLDMLQRTRPKKPVHGLIVAVGADDLLQGDQETDVGQLARNLRLRVDEVLARLKLVLPVYVLITKCDQLEGFVETFRALRKAEREAIWGCTLALEKPAESSLTAVVEQHLAELEETLRGVVCGRMGLEPNADVRGTMFQLPENFGRLRSRVAQFLEELFTQNVYQGAPMMRGVYFSSGTQFVSISARAMAGMVKAYQLEEKIAGAAQPAPDAKGFFLRRLFSDVVIADKDVARLDKKSLQRQRWFGMAAAGVMVVTALLLSFLPVHAFRQNRRLLANTRHLVEAAQTETVAKSQRLIAPAAVEGLRRELESIISFENSAPPLAMRFGMYQGKRIFPGLAHFYVRTLQTSLLEFLLRDDVAEMRDFWRKYEYSQEMPPSVEYSHFFLRLKLHLLLTAPRGSDEPPLDGPQREWLQEHLVARWAAGVEPRSGPQALAQMQQSIAMYFDLLARYPDLAMGRQPQVVSTTRSVLQRVSLEDALLEHMIPVAEEQGYALTLTSMVGGAVVPLRPQTAVRGLFTRAGWEKLVRPRLDSSVAASDGWVLGKEFAGGTVQKNADLLTARVRSRYFERYIEEWRVFLYGLQPEKPRDVTEALQALRDLTRGEPPPYKRLLETLAANVRLSPDAKAAAGGSGGQKSGVVQRLKGTFDRGLQQASALWHRARALEDGEAPGGDAGLLVGEREVEQAFAPLTDFAVSPPRPSAAGEGVAAAAGDVAKSLPIDIYQEELLALRDHLQNYIENPDQRSPMEARRQQARTVVRGLFERIEQGSGWRPFLENILWTPIDVVSQRIDENMGQGTADKWCTAVVLPFARSLEGRYPFQKESVQDASVADVVQFFKPVTGTLWGFYEAHLKGDIQQVGPRFQFVRPSAGGAYNGEILGWLARAFAVTSALFAPGTAQPHVELFVRVQPAPAFSKIALEVNGQVAEYRGGLERWQKLLWPGDAARIGATIRALGRYQRAETMNQEGEWGLLRLLESGHMVAEPGSGVFSVTWETNTPGETVNIDFRPSRADTPFFGMPAPKGAASRSLSPFRQGSLRPPSRIARTAPACPY